MGSGGGATAKDLAAEHERRGVARSQLGDSGRVVNSCVVIGGYEHPLEDGARCSVAFAREFIRAAGPTVNQTWPYDELVSFRVGGPGVLQSGGGFFGGGFGIEGAVKGMAVASLLNAATARTEVQTILHLVLSDCEVIFLSSAIAPQDLEIALAPVAGRLRARNPASEPVSGGGIAQLKQLAELHAAGALTEEEFAAAKRRVIEGL